MLDVTGLKLAPKEAAGPDAGGHCVDALINNGDVEGVRKPCGTSCKGTNQQGIVNFIDIIFVESQTVRETRRPGGKTFRRQSPAIVEEIGEEKTS